MNCLTKRKHGCHIDCIPLLIDSVVWLESKLNCSLIGQSTLELNPWPTGLEYYSLHAVSGVQNSCTPLRTRFSLWMYDAIYIKGVCRVSPPLRSRPRRKREAAGLATLTWTAWVRFLPSPKHKTCICCSARSGLMKQACLGGCLSLCPSLKVELEKE